MNAANTLRKTTAEENIQSYNLPEH